MLTRPPMIRTDHSNAFAHDTMQRRLPANIREIQALNPDYPASIHDSLKRLAEAIEYNVLIGAFDPLAPDIDLWEKGQLDERLRALIHLDLWGNRIDLSFQSSLAHGNSGSHEDLLVDDSAAVVNHLMKAKGDVHFITDNTGTEPAMDSALTDALFDLRVSRVVFHLKMHPTFVSDTTVPDMHIMLERMTSAEHGFETAQLGGRLQAALNEGRLRLAPDFFWNSPYMPREMPQRLAGVFKSAALVISKGDLNYRRMVEDALFPPCNGAIDTAAAMSEPVAALGGTSRASRRHQRQTPRHPPSFPLHTSAAN